MFHMADDETHRRERIFMHVALNGWFWNQSHVGSGQYLHHLVTHLPRIDSNLTISLILPPGVAAPQNLPDRVNAIPTNSFLGRGNAGKVWFEQRIFPQQAAGAGADLAHVPYWGPPLSSSVPLVTSVLDVVPLMFPAYATGMGSRLYTGLASAAARGANHIITISQTSKLDIEEYLNIPTDDISVTYLAPDDRYHPQMGADRDDDVREKYNLPEQFVLYLGGYDLRKQVNQLLMAYTFVGEAEGDNIPLVLAGREPDWSQGLFPNMREYAKRLNVADYVQWVGHIDEDDKPSVYRLADVFVWPSEYEGFGLPPLEAMACGTPVVAWDSIVADEVLEDGAFLVEDSRRMAGSIIALLLQQPLRESMINTGIAQAKKYSWRQTAIETRRVYENVLRRS
jgi:glycosyltransferase involved in cell wall biosynthesis